MNESINVNCPSCQHQFSLSQGVLSSVREGLTRELQRDITEREKALEADKQTIQSQQTELKRQQSEMQQAIATRVEEQLKAQKALILAEAEEKANLKVTEALSLRLKDLEQDRDEKSEALKKSRAEQLALLAEKRKLTEEKENLEIENLRKLAAAEEKIRHEAQKKADDASRLKILEKEKIISDLSSQLQDAQRKADQGSIQNQGEVFEQDFEQQLRQAFPIDVIAPISVGVRGADISLEVISRTGRSCGKILFENKRTRTWQDGWTAKLHSDMRSAQADIGIIVTETLPKGIDTFGQKDGVWVTDYASAIPLAHSLRALLSEVMIAKGHREGAREKMELLYDYLTGNEFRQRLQLVVQAFRSMKIELDKERSYLTSKWNKREKQINLVIENMSGMVGDIQGLSGGALEALPLFDDDDSDEEPEMKLSA